MSLAVRVTHRRASRTLRFGGESRRFPGTYQSRTCIHNGSPSVLLQPEIERRRTRVILQLGRSLAMRKSRKIYTPVEKAAILLRHLIDQAEKVSRRKSGGRGVSGGKGVRRKRGGKGVRNRYQRNRLLCPSSAA